jgi:hypothetical protein
MGSRNARISINTDSDWSAYYRGIQIEYSSADSSEQIIEFEYNNISEVHEKLVKLLHEDLTVPNKHKGRWVQDYFRGEMYLDLCSNNLQVDFGNFHFYVFLDYKTLKI